MNKSIILVLLSIITLSCTTSNHQQAQLSDYVDPNIGSAGCRWFLYTPGAMPFGMAKLGPSTNAHYGNPGGWEAVGYDFRDESIEGFACFHEFQIGGVVLAPSVGELRTIPGDTSMSNQASKGYRSAYQKKNQYATSGYYSVILDDYQVKAELTATERTGFQRYTFPSSDSSHILFDIGNQQGESGRVKDAKITYTDNGRVEGYVVTSPEYVKKYQAGAEIRMYFSATIDKVPQSFGTFIKEKHSPNAKEASGLGAGMYFTFKTKEQEAITVKIGLSYTSISNARLNMETEAKNLSFDQAQKNALAKWNEQLGRIQVETKSKEDKTKFYTGLWHALLGRGLASDVNGAYPMNNGQIGQIELNEKGKPKHNHYNTDAIWGGFWNLTQLWSIAYPSYYADWIASQLLVYKETGWLGDGIACSKYVSGVGTNFTSLAIAAAYNCGIRNYDVDIAYQAALNNELGYKNRLAGAGKLDTKAFIEMGYSPYIKSLGYDTDERGSGFGGSHTLEYSFSAYAVAQFAKNLDKTEDYNKLMLLSNSWKNLYDPQTKMIRPKNEFGEFIDHFNPMEPWRGFQEGNAAQYTFYVPHDVNHLVQLIGSDIFNKRLDSVFQKSEKLYFGGGKEIDAFAGLNTLYNQGNQPNIQMPWLFNYSGAPYLSQKWVRRVCDLFYGVEGIHGYGFGQDEDQGQLGAWYVMSSIGLFDVEALTSPNPSFSVGSPLFDKVSIQLPNNKTFTIEAANNSKENVYIQQLEFEGKALDNYRINYSDVIKGGKLKLILGNKPKIE